MRKAINSRKLKAHKNPIPHASSLRGIVISSSISGADVEGIYSSDKEEQIHKAFKNMEIVLNEANASFDDVIKFDLYFSDKNDRKFVNPIWLKLFPDKDSRPARHSHLVNLDGDCIFQIVFTAVKSGNNHE